MHTFSTVSTFSTFSTFSTISKSSTFSTLYTFSYVHSVYRLYTFWWLRCSLGYGSPDLDWELIAFVIIGLSTSREVASFNLPCIACRLMYLPHYLSFPTINHWHFHFKHPSYEEKCRLSKYSIEMEIPPSPLVGHHEWKVSLLKTDLVLDGYVFRPFGRFSLVLLFLNMTREA